MRYPLPPLLDVDGVLLATDILTEKFCCDLDACGGACCVEGDAGAPLLPEEADELRRVLPEVRDRLSDEARRILDSQGVAYYDRDGDLVTSIVNGKDCVFTCYGADGCCYCATEKVYREGRTAWCKPISCYLYPIREKRLSNGTVALNYHRWSVCSAAVRKGRELHLPLYRFLEAPLVRRFGQTWYDHLCQTVEELRKQGYLGLEKGE